MNEKGGDDKRVKFEEALPKEMEINNKKGRRTCLFVYTILMLYWIT